MTDHDDSDCIGVCTADDSGHCLGCGRKLRD